MAVPIITDLKMWVGTLFTKDDWDFNFSKIVGWLSDGSSDLVVNSIKATNGIDLDGAQITNLGPATTGSQAITLDQAETLLNRTGFYNPFTVASGKVDSTGNAAYLQKDSDTQVTVLAGNVNPDLVCVSSDGTIESVTSNTVLTIPTSDGTYHIIKEKGESITITAGASGKVTVDRAFPSSPNIGDYFLDNSVLPFKGYKYTTNGWEETAFCWIGDVTVASGASTVTQFDYNDNKYDVNRNNQAVIVESFVSGRSGYNLYSNKYIEQWGFANGPAGAVSTANFLKNFRDANVSITIGEYAGGSSGIGGNEYFIIIGNPWVSGFRFMYGGGSEGAYWKACGYVA